MGTLRKMFFVVALCLAPAYSQQSVPAPEYESVFHRDQGWTGADGTYSFPMNDGRTMWGFSDTFFGEVRQGQRDPQFRFVHNSMVLQDGSEFTFLQAPVFTPPPSRQKSWFWLFDGAENEQILLGEFAGDTDETGLGFRQVGLWAARYRLDDGESKVRVTGYTRLPFFDRRDSSLITFGPAVLQTPSWLYFYGVLDRDGGRHSVLARAPRGCMAQPGTWRFYDGTGWNRELWSAKPLFVGASMEASVHQTASGEYLYISNDAGGMNRQIIARVAPRPEGPWGEPMVIAEAPEHHGDVYAYNAKAHPELTRDGRILVSYNVNTLDLAKVVDDADIYRPRFLWWTPPNDGWLPKR